MHNSFMWVFVRNLAAKVTNPYLAAVLCDVGHAGHDLVPEESDNCEREPFSLSLFGAYREKTNNCTPVPH